MRYSGWLIFASLFFKSKHQWRITRPYRYWDNGYKKLSDECSVGSKIQPDDVAALANSGFRSIICNRPDGEAENQPAFEQINEASEANNMVARYLPVVPGKIGSEEAEQFKQALSDLPSPVFAYCRTGYRSNKLWSRNQPKSKFMTILLSLVNKP